MMIQKAGDNEDGGRFVYHVKRERDGLVRIPTLCSDLKGVSSVVPEGGELPPLPPLTTYCRACLAIHGGEE